MKIGLTGFEATASELEALDMGAGGWALYALLWTAYSRLLNEMIVKLLPIPVDNAFKISVVLFALLGVLVIFHSAKTHVDRVRIARRPLEAEISRLSFDRERLYANAQGVVSMVGDAKFLLDHPEVADRDKNLLNKMELLATAARGLRESLTPTPVGARK